MPPHVRRASAFSSDRATNDRRLEIDRSGGFRKPQNPMRIGRPCRRPPPRPPPGDDTLAPQDFGDRRGAPAGVATSYRWPATWLLHHAPDGVATAERFHAATNGRPPLSNPHTGVRCVRARGTADARSMLRRPLPQTAFAATIFWRISIVSRRIHWYASDYDS